MFRYSKIAGTAAVFFGALTSHAHAETFTLDPVVIEGSTVHRSQELINEVEKGMNANRSNSYLCGAVLQNLNPVNSGDAFRYNVPGIINQPGEGDRFGGGTKIRTFGDFGAATSIDGGPALRIQGQEPSTAGSVTTTACGWDTSLKTAGRAGPTGTGIAASPTMSFMASTTRKPM